MMPARQRGKIWGAARGMFFQTNAFGVRDRFYWRKEMHRARRDPDQDLE